MIQVTHRHTCTDVAPGCSHGSMSTFKRRLVHGKVKCKACSTNTLAGRPQHESQTS